MFTSSLSSSSKYLWMEVSAKCINVNEEISFLAIKVLDPFLAFEVYMFRTTSFPFIYRKQITYVIHIVIEILLSAW